MSDDFKLKFGKYEGYTLEEVYDEGEEGIGYLEWLRDITDVNDKKWGAANKKLVRMIDGVLGDVSGGAGPEKKTPPKRTQAQAAPKSNGDAVTLLKSIDAHLKRIETILANPGKPHVAEADLAPDNEVPF